MVTRTFRGTTYDVTTATTNSRTINVTTKPAWIEVLGGNNQVFTGLGNDVVLAGVNFLSTGIYPPFGGEAIFWNSRTDAGNNTISTGGGNDYVAAGAGGNDVVDLGAGDDIFDGAVSNISLQTGNDTINAGAGNDIVYAWGLGNKKINAGGGNDFVSVRSFSDTIINSFYRNIIITGAGDDTIIADSPDAIFTVEAGTGNDFIDIKSSGGTFDAGEGNDDIYTLFADGNAISGGAGNDLMIIDAGLSTRNIVLGGSGDDIIVTTSILELDPNDPSNPPPGNHEIHGGAGNDTLFSGIGSDTIYDDIGDDIINLRGGLVNLRGQLSSNNYFNTDKLEIQGGGIDTLYLGEGKDTVLLGKKGNAIIYGFTQIDRLDLGGLNVSLSNNLQGDTILTTTDLQLGKIQLATLIGYTGQVNII
jgi:Ca2+-binding RTX toxin-like protein